MEQPVGKDLRSQIPERLAGNKAEQMRHDDCLVARIGVRIVETMPPHVDHRCRVKKEDMKAVSPEERCMVAVAEGRKGETRK
ncbi:hypothetical protein FHS96_005667 [Sphingomonas zeicaulis]|uniref:hypothetical protein n=1 Tax=Sphingomonas zeicaulis TaxID=1632740 RepID=UPI003D20E22E